MKFEKKADRIYVAIARVTYAQRYTGIRKSREIAFRIDGREGTYRADKLGTLGYIWEAIDDGQGFATVAKAQKYVRAYVRAIKEQGDDFPTNVARA